MTEYSTVTDLNGKKGKIYFFVVPKDYKIGDKIQTEGRPLAFSVLMREGGYVNIYRDPKEKVEKIHSWLDDEHFSKVYDCHGSNEFHNEEGTNSYFI